MTSLLSHDEDMAVTSYRNEKEGKTSYEDQCEIVYIEHCSTKYVEHSTPLFKKHCHKPCRRGDARAENEEVIPLAKLVE